MKYELGIVLPVRGAREYTEFLMPHLVREIDWYLHDHKVNLVIMDSGKHEDYRHGKSHTSFQAIRDVESFEVTYIKVKDPDQSLYKTWNEGTRATEAKVILMINNDLLLVPRAFYDMFAVLSDHRFDLVMPAQVPTQEDIANNQENKIEEITVVPGRMQLTGWCFGYPRKYFDAVKGFNEDYRLWYGDIEFFARAADDRMATVTSSGVFHFFSKTNKTLTYEDFKNKVLGDYIKAKQVEIRDRITLDTRNQEQFETMLVKNWAAINQ